MLLILIACRYGTSCVQIFIFNADCVLMHTSSQPFRDYRDSKRRREEGQDVNDKKTWGGFWKRLCYPFRCCFGIDGGGQHEEWEKDEHVDLSLGQVVVSRGSDMYLQMLLRDNLMHADCE